VSASLLTGQDFFDLFRSFSHTAYRLEVRESYYEKKQLGQFLSNEPVDLDYMTEWLGIMVQARTEGKRVERVRVVSKPFSDYTRYGLWLCRYNLQAGEDIRYLDRSNAVSLPNHDYWLLDSSRLYIVHFTESDEVVGAELVKDDPAALVQHNLWRDTAWHHAIPYSHFSKANGVGEHPASAGSARRAPA
jgi:hypothetical protein